jgi:hypothetical protein
LIRGGVHGLSYRACATLRGKSSMPFVTTFISLQDERIAIPN